MYLAPSKTRLSRTCFEVFYRITVASAQQSLFRTIMVNETSYVSSTEQVVNWLRLVDELFEVQEDLIGLYKVAATNTGTIEAAI